MKLHNVRLAIKWGILFSVIAAIFSSTVIHAAQEDKPFKLVIDGKALSFSEDKPVKVDGRWLLPTRSVMQALGSTPVWNGKERTVKLSLQDDEASIEVNILIDSPYIQRTLVADDSSYSEIIAIDVPAKTIKGRTMLPLRAVAELLGYNLQWKESTNTATLTASSTLGAVTFPSYEVKGDIRKLSADELRAFFLTNELRDDYGQSSSFILNVELSLLARVKSKDMLDNEYFDHNSPQLGTPFQMMKNYGFDYQLAGENIAYGYRSAETVLDGWENSPPHLTNMLNEYAEIGIGHTRSYWTQLFYTPKQ